MPSIRRVRPLGDGLTAVADINPNNWGLAYNVALETGGALVSEKVRIELEIHLVPAG